MPKTKPCPLVMIEWVDSVQPSPQWVLLSEYEQRTALTCRSVGWLIQDTAKAKVIAANMAGDSVDNIQGCGLITIPTCAILRITKLKER